MSVRHEMSVRPRSRRLARSSGTFVHRHPPAFPLPPAMHCGESSGLGGQTARHDPFGQRLQAALTSTPQRRHPATPLSRLKQDQPASYKTKACRSFARTGHCQYGPRCRFMHGDAAAEAQQLATMRLADELPVGASEPGSSMHLSHMLQPHAMCPAATHPFPSGVQPQPARSQCPTDAGAHASTEELTRNGFLPHQSARAPMPPSQSQPLPLPLPLPHPPPTQQQALAYGRPRSHSNESHASDDVMDRRGMWQPLLTAPAQRTPSTPMAMADGSPLSTASPADASSLGAILLPHAQLPHRGHKLLPHACSFAPAQSALGVPMGGDGWGGRPPVAPPMLSLSTAGGLSLGGGDFPSALAPSLRTSPGSSTEPSERPSPLMRPSPPTRPSPPMLPLPLGSSLSATQLGPLPPSLQGVQGSAAPLGQMGAGGGGGGGLNPPPTTFSLAAAPPPTACGVAGSGPIFTAGEIEGGAARAPRGVNEPPWVAGANGGRDGLSGSFEAKLDAMGFADGGRPDADARARAHSIARQLSVLFDDERVD